MNEVKNFAKKLGLSQSMLDIRWNLHGRGV